MALNSRQRAFVKEYLVDRNGTRAAIAAGYSSTSARSIASENLTKPDIFEAIALGLDAFDHECENRARESERKNEVTVQGYREVINRALSGPISDLQIMCDDPETPAFQVGVIRAIFKAIKTGNARSLDTFITRLVGNACDFVPPNAASVDPTELAKAEAKVSARLRKIQAKMAWRTG